MLLSRLVALAKYFSISIAIIFSYVGAVQATPPTFSASLSPGTVGPGNVSQLTFTITNVDATPVTNASFTNVLPAGIVHTTPSSILTSCDNGSVTAPDASDTLTFSNYDIPGSSSCTVTVDLLSSTTAGTYNIVSGALSSDEGSSGTASVDLIVATDRPGYSMSFSPNSINQGANSTLTLAFDNTQNGSALTSMSTTVNFPAGLVIADDPNVSHDCETSPVAATVTANAGSGSLVYSYSGNASFPAIAAAGTCSLTVDVKATGVGTLVASSTSVLGNFIDGGGAKSVLTSNQAFAFMEFEDNPTTPGATTNLNITLTNFDRNDPITNIAFSDDLDAALTGLAATSLPSDPCGAGSSLSGTSTISLSNGTLAAGASCTFSVPVLIPAGATASSNTNTTSTFTYELNGDGVVKPAVSHNLTITQAPTIALSISPDPIGAGNDITASFTITNIDATQAASDLAFTAELTTFLPFPVTVPTLPAAPCGGSSTIALNIVPGSSDRQELALTGGDLAAGANCNFDVIISIPDSQPFGTYSIVTDPITATINSASVTGGTTSDSFEIITAPNLTVGFDNTSVVPGGSTNATFTLSSSSNAPADATATAFTVDLDAALTGLTATAFNNNTCTGSTVSGTSLITFSDGVIAPGASCSFDATLQLPGGGSSSTVNITSSAVSATVDGNGVTSPAVTSSFNVVTLIGSLAISDNDGDGDNNVQPGSTTATLDFTFTNTSASVNHNDFDFSMSLSTALSGLASSSGTVADPCGSGSSISGTTFLNFTAGNLAAGATCNFSITLTVPGGAADGNYTVTSSSIFSNDPVVVLGVFTGSMTVEQDLAPSIVSITSSVSPLTGVAPIPMDIVFSEDVEGFVEGDITVTNGTASNLVQVSADHYTFDITSPTDPSTIDVQLLAGVVEELGAGVQTNTASSVFSIDYDTSALPTGLITVPAGVKLNTGPTTATVTYSNATIHNLTNDKVNLVTTGTASTTNFVDNDTPNPDISIIDGTTATPTIQISNIIGDGTIALGLDGFTARNDVGDVQAIPDSTESYSVDNTSSTVAITSGVSDPTNSAFTANFDFTDPNISGPDTTITGFTSGDIILNNATLSGFAGSGSSYSATITPIANGLVTIDINAGVAVDDHGNGNTAATQFSVTNDISAPTGYAVAIDTPQTFINAANDTAFQFSYSGAELTSQYSWTVTDGTNTSTPVTGTITTTSGSFTGIDVSSFNEGTLTLSFTLTDVAGNTGVASTDTIIKQYNDAPIITEGASIGVTMTEDGNPTAFSLTLNATDPESETITWSVSSAASNGTATATGTGNSKVIGYVPNGDFNGSDSFTVEITDNNALDPLTDSIVVNVTVDPGNDTPTFDSTEVTVAVEDSVYVYLITTSDIDVSDNLTLSASTIPGWLSLTDNGDGTGTLTGTPLNDDVGSNAVTLEVIDDSGAANDTATQSFNIIVANTNDAPTIDSSAINSATEDATYTYNIVTSDIDTSDSRSITATTLPGWLTLTDNGDGTATLAGTPLNADVGGNNVVLVVTDLASATDTQSFSINVANTNDAPTFSSSGVTSALEDSAYTYNVVANDVDIGDTLAISASTIPAWLTLVDNSNGTATLSGVPDNDDVGTHSVTLIVTDNSGAGNNTGTQSFNIIVANTNDAPTIDSTAITSATEDSVYTYNVVTSDVDSGDSRSITATTLPGWLTLTDNGNGTATLTGTPLNGDVGGNTVVLVVTDLASATDTQSFSINVANTNDAPTFSSSGVTSALEDSTYTYNVVTNDVDIGDTLAISASTIPVWLTLVDNGNGTATLSGVPDNDDVGTHSVTLIVTDNSGAGNNTGTQSFNVIVANTNDAPTIDSTAITSATEDSVYTYNVVTSDVDSGDSRSITATTLPGWLTLTDNGNGTAMLTGTPLNADVGANNVSILVTDAAGATANQDFTITVENTNDNVTGLPVITGELLRTETLAVDTSLISDDDGLGPYSYQWRRGGLDVSGATASTYLLGEADVWQTFTVVVSFTDLAGNDEFVESAATGEIFDLDSDGDGIYDLEEGTGDSDGDGIPDYLDTDSDNDGIPDSEEGNGDSDGDGIADYLDTSLDEDGDGVPDILEGNNSLDTDGDGTADAFDTDSDNDGITDAEESGATGIDSDGDGIDDAFDVDITGGVDANGDGVDDAAALLDSDGDGIPDYIDRDSDNDSVPDTLENRTGLALQQISKLSQQSQMTMSDTDGDGVMDYLDPDSDEDGIGDLAEAATTVIDSDMDQIIDEFDVDFTGGLDANLDGVDDAAVLLNSDNDITPDMFDLDADNDGHNDVNEAGLSDIDLNALVDSPDELTNTPQDSDADGLADYRDLDSDNDGIFDIETSGAATLDIDGDGQIDDASVDTDGDGIIDAMDDEPTQFGTSPDRDLDGVPSSVDLDDDADGLTDQYEGNLDTDGDGLVDSLDSDSDGDGISDSEEQLLVALSGIDADRDGLDDAVDVDMTGGVDSDGDGQDDSTISTEDMDGDGLLAYLDTDTDGDGISDINENGDFNNDGVNDRLQAETVVTATSGGGALGIISFLAFIAVMGRKFRICVNHLTVAWLRRKSVKLLGLAALLISFNANAACGDETSESTDSDSCWYFGIGLGQSSLDPQVAGSSWSVKDDTDMAGGFTFGYELNESWFAEVGHILLGKANLENNNPAFPNEGFINYNVTDLVVGYRFRPEDSNFSFAISGGTASLETNSNFIENDSESIGVFGLEARLNKSTNRALSMNYDQYGDDIGYFSINLIQYF